MRWTVPGTVLVMDWNAVARGEPARLDGGTGEAALDALVGCPQTARHHGEGDVAVHTEMVLDATASVLARSGFDEAAAERLRLAAVLHDVGKPVTVVETAPCEFSSPRHAEAGAKIVTSLFDANPQLRARALPTRAAVAATVRAHMWAWHPENVSPGAAIRTAHLVPLDELFALWSADAAGRISVDAAELTERVAWASALISDHVGGVLADPYPHISAVTDPHSLDPRVRRSVLRAVVDGRVTSTGAAAAHIAATERRSNGARIIWMSGLPGSGKSTAAATIASNVDAEVLTVAGARRRDRDASRGANRARLAEIVRSGGSVVVDATHLTRDSRDRLCALADIYGATLDAVVVDTPSRVCIERQRHRPSGAAVPAETIRSMLASWRWPTPDEYDTLTVIDATGRWAYTPPARDALLAGGPVPSELYLGAPR